MSKAPPWFRRDRGDGSHLRFTLRPATHADLAYVERLYLETMAPLLSRLGALDEPELVAHFRRGYEPGESWIVTVGGRDAGWLQVHDSGSDLNLSQIHLEHPYRNRGIGTDLVHGLQAHASAFEKSVSLSVVRNNRAVDLYRRLGFELTGQDETKLHLVWRDRASDGHGAGDEGGRREARTAPPIES